MAKNPELTTGTAMPNSTAGGRILAGIRLVVARTGNRRTSPASALEVALTAAGAEVTVLPLVHEERADPAIIEHALGPWDAIDWVLVTGDDALDELADVLARTGRRQGTHKLACLGPSAGARAAERGWQVEIATESHAVGAIVDELAMRDDVDGTAMLVLCALETKAALHDGLVALGVDVSLVTVSRTASDAGIADRLHAMAAAGALDLLILTSSSAVDALQEALPAELTRRYPTACIGGQTARAARMAGFPVRIEQEYLSPANMIRAIGTACAGRR